MRKLILNIFMAVTIACAIGVAPAMIMKPATAYAQNEKKVHAVIMLDTSGSNPIVSIDGGHYASNVALMFDKRLPALTAGSLVSFETFGELDVKKQIRKEITVSVSNRPKKVRNSLKHLISNIPAYIQKGTIAVQGATNIVGSLQDLSGRLRCAEYETYVFVLTDGIESSVYGNLPPKNAPEMFKGCKAIYFIGVTAENAKRTLTLKQAWEAWAKESGFETVQAIR